MLVTKMSSQFPPFRLTVAAQMTEYRQRIAEQIRKEREKRGWRREDLAQKTGASYRQIERWETGKSKPQPANLEKLAEVFEVDVAVLRPDLEAEEEELRTHLKRIENNQELILGLLSSALGISPDAAAEAAETAALETSEQRAPSARRRPAKRKQRGDG